MFHTDCGLLAPNFHLTVETTVFNSQQLFPLWCNSVVTTVHYDFAV